MQDTELFLSLAEIAGVFVGFGALIAVRSGGAGEPQEVAPMRVVVGFGMLTVIAALAPVTLGRYDLGDHEVLALSSVLVTIVFGVLLFVQVRSPEYKAARAIVMPTRPAVQTAVENVAWLLIWGGSALALVVIVLGVAPGLEGALYFTVVVLLLVIAAWTLLWLVFMQRRPQTASEPAALPAMGGSMVRRIGIRSSPLYTRGGSLTARWGGSLAPPPPLLPVALLLGPLAAVHEGADDDRGGSPVMKPGDEARVASVPAETRDGHAGARRSLVRALPHRSQQGHRCRPGWTGWLPRLRRAVSLRRSGCVASATPPFYCCPSGRGHPRDRPGAGAPDGQPVRRRPRAPCHEDQREQDQHPRRDPPDRAQEPAAGEVAHDLAVPGEEHHEDEDERQQEALSTWARNITGMSGRPGISTKRAAKPMKKTSRP